ncbi:hypothetical protein [Streptacidiphilus pinicola]|nr:hypothetical protein [Streptacidiphilus pinicola]
MAEYGVGAGVRWHIVPETDGSRALCHRMLSPNAEMRPLTGTAGGIEGAQVCRRCCEVFERGSAPAERTDDTSEPP